MSQTVCVSFKVLPGGLADKAATYAAVDRAIEVIQRSGLKHLVGPSETTIEGEYDQVMAAIKLAQEAVLAVAPRQFTLIGIDWNPAGSSIDEKLAKYRT
jgi:uncharacterized protein YqgV (UPF0045/DUF77 family)